MSIQQQKYLELRANGLPRIRASAQSGLPIGECALLDKAIERGEAAMPPPSTPSPAAGQAAQPKGDVEVAKPKPEAVAVPDAPDFLKAARIFHSDIKPNQEKVGEHAQEMSTAYKEIKNKCRVNTRAAKFAFKLAEESEEKRNDILRSLRGMFDVLGIKITDDLVSQAEDEDAGRAIIASGVSTEPAGLATVQ